MAIMVTAMATMDMAITEFYWSGRRRVRRLNPNNTPESEPGCGPGDNETCKYCYLDRILVL
jgi:hypothetical protein